MAKKKEEKTDAKAGPGSDFNLEIYQRDSDKMWSFRVNGEESLYRSSSKDGLNRTIKALMFGVPTGNIILKPVKGQAKAKMAGGETQEVELTTDNSWSSLPTQDERLKAFLSRGKLAKKGT